MSIDIRKATIDNLEELYNVEKEAFTDEAFSKRQIATLLQAPNSIGLLACIDGKIVGFSIGLTYKRKDGRIGHLLTLDVAVRARRKGVGLRLLKEFEQDLRAIGIKECFLEVGIDNLAARELYRKAGYVETAFLKDFYCLGGDGIRLVKTFQ